MDSFLQAEESETNSKLGSDVGLKSWVFSSHGLLEQLGSVGGSSDRRLESLAPLDQPGCRGGEPGLGLRGLTQVTHPRKPLPVPHLSME